MLIIGKRKYVEDINNFGYNYGKKFLSDLQCVSFIDSSFAQSIVREIDTFAPILRMQCLNDATTLHNDLKIAKQLQNDYDSFGDFCYDMLHDCFDASNQCMQLNNKLAQDINDLTNLQVSDLAVASNFVGWNTFSKQAKLILTNFRSVAGIGQTYDISFNAHGTSGIQTNNVQEQISPQLSRIIEISEILSMIQSNDSKLNMLLREWSSWVNDKLAEHKEQSIVAWQCTYETYKSEWFDIQFRKQIKDIYCTLSIKNGRVTELLHRYGKSNHVDWGTNVNVVPKLDYLNITNLKFEE